jgi:membrane-associated phospholipid phosphatase
MRGTGIFLLICLSLSNPAKTQNSEQRFLEYLTRHRTAGMTRFMQGISNTTTEISLAVPAGLFIAGMVDRDAVMEKKSGYIIETIAVGSGIAIALKYIINRPRPSTQDSLIIPESDMGSPSFPSGHSSIAFATATSLSLAYPKWYIVVPAYAWACTVGFSRLYLGVHYPTDVLGGIICGAGCAILCRKLNKLLFQQKPVLRKFVWY